MPGKRLLSTSKAKTGATDLLQPQSRTTKGYFLPTYLYLKFTRRSGRHRKKTLVDERQPSTQRKSRISLKNRRSASKSRPRRSSRTKPTETTRLTPITKEKNIGKRSVTPRRTPTKLFKEDEQAYRSPRHMRSTRLAGKTDSRRKHGPSTSKKSSHIKVKESQQRKSIKREVKIELKEERTSGMKTSKPSKSRKTMKGVKIELKQEPVGVCTRRTNLACKLEYQEERRLGKIEAKALRRERRREEMARLPSFPRQETYVEDLILDAIRGLKAKALEGQIVTYLEKRFSDVDVVNIKNVLEKMRFEQRVSLRKVPDVPAKDKRRIKVCDGESFRESPKKRKLNKESSSVKQEAADLRRHEKIEEKVEEEEGEDEETSVLKKEPSEPRIGLLEELQRELNIKDEELGLRSSMTEERIGRVATRQQVEQTPRRHREQVKPLEQELDVKLSESCSRKQFVNSHTRQRLGCTSETGQTREPEVRDTSEGSQPEVLGEITKKEENEETVRRCEINKFSANETKQTGESRADKTSLHIENSVFAKEKVEQDAMVDENEENLEKIEEEMDKEQKMVVWEPLRRNEEALQEQHTKESKDKDVRNNRIRELLALLSAPATIKIPKDDQVAENTEKEEKLEEKKEEQDLPLKEEETLERRPEPQSTQQTSKEQPNRELYSKASEKEKDAVEKYLERLQKRIDYREMFGAPKRIEEEVESPGKSSEEDAMSGEDIKEEDEAEKSVSKFFTG